MHQDDLARRLPDDVWAEFAPHLPERVYAGTSPQPYSNRECRYALGYVLASGIAWELLPWCFPSSKTVRRRLRNDAFLRA